MNQTNSFKRLFSYGISDENYEKNKKCKMGDMTTNFAMTTNDMNDDDSNDNIPEITADLLNKLCNDNSNLILTKEYGSKIIAVSDSIKPDVFSLNYLRLIGGIEAYEYWLDQLKLRSKAFDKYKTLTMLYSGRQHNRIAGMLHMALLISGVHDRISDEPSSEIEKCKTKYIMRGITVDRLW